MAVYPLGSGVDTDNGDYMDTIYDVINHAKTKSCYKKDLKTYFCTMLDGDGVEVFDTLRECFTIARDSHKERTGGSHITMTATLTANKSAWK